MAENRGKRLILRTTLNCLLVCSEHNLPSLAVPRQQRQRLAELPTVLECQWEGQADAASWPWSPHPETLPPLSCDTVVRAEGARLPVSNPQGCVQAVTCFCTVIGLGFSSPREELSAHSSACGGSHFPVTPVVGGFSV